MHEAKKQLLKVKLYDVNINNKLEDRARLEELATRVSTRYSSAPKGGSGDKIGRAAASILDLESDLDRQIDHYVSLKRQVTDIIGKITDPDYVEILYKRYVLFKKADQIAEEMHIDSSTYSRKHKAALDLFLKIIKDAP